MILGEEQIADARNWAHEIHDGQTDKLGVPLYAHLAHVAQQVRRFGPEYETAAWLHDAVEDTNVTLEDIHSRFGPIVARSVDALTRRQGEVYFQDYIPRAISHPIGIVVKYADSRHNRAKVHLLPDAKDRIRLAKYYDRNLNAMRDAQWQLSRWGDLGDLTFDGYAWVEAPG